MEDKERKQKKQKKTATRSSKKKLTGPTPASANPAAVRESLLGAGLPKTGGRSAEPGRLISGPRVEEGLRMGEPGSAQALTADGGRDKAGCPAEKARLLKVRVSDLIVDASLQARTMLNQKIVSEYARAMCSGEQFPPVAGVEVGGRILVWDGLHRVAAALQAKLEMLPVVVTVGTRRDALLHAAGANATHGLRRTNADKRKAVQIVLADEEWVKWSDAEIARHCGVSVSFVGKRRKEQASIDGLKMGPGQRKVCRGGVEYEMDVTAVGKKKKKKQAQPQASDGSAGPDSNPEPEDVLENTSEPATKAAEARSEGEAPAAGGVLPSTATEAPSAASKEDGMCAPQAEGHDRESAGTLTRGPAEQSQAHGTELPHPADQPASVPHLASPVAVEPTSPKVSTDHLHLLLLRLPESMDKSSQDRVTSGIVRQTTQNRPVLAVGKYKAILAVSEAVKQSVGTHVTLRLLVEGKQICEANLFLPAMDVMDPALALARVLDTSYEEDARP